MTASNGNGDPEALREEIRQTRADLGATVQALAAKADVKTRVKQEAVRKKDQVRAQAMQRSQQVRGQVMQKSQQMRSRATRTKEQLLTQAGQQAGQAGGQARQSAGMLRVSARRTADLARRYPVPMVAGAAVAALGTMAILRRRRG